MQVCIRRGATQIGGSAVEITARSGKRIVIDLGLPLDAPENCAELLPEIEGLSDGSQNLSGILISHAHQDHYALLKHVHKSVPVFMGQAAQNILNIATQHFLPNAFAFEQKILPLKHKETFCLDDFKITPYSVDHSAYDAYAFLIEADGKRLFYSGDFRAHGRKSALFNSFIKNPPKNIDALLMEGSCFGRDGAEKYETETALEKQFSDIFQKTKECCFVLASSQNIDRIVTVYRACKKSGRQLVLSGYTGHILMGLENKKLPNFTWSDVKKYTLDAQKRHEISQQKIVLEASKYVVFLSGGIFRSLKDSRLFNQNASFIYSMWNGYKEKQQKMLDFIENQGTFMTDIHTSGHADIETLKSFVDALLPKQIIPIHTFFPDQFQTQFNNVVLHADNEVFDL